jgi:Leucine-rich repeat (LRR) protein/GTPase SAR1 family protein
MLSEGAVNGGREQPPNEAGAACCLDLSRTHLEVIPLPVFQMTWLTSLDVSGCMLETLPRLLCDLISLQHLLAHDNELRTVPMELIALTGLTTLRLDGNHRLAADFAPTVLNLVRFRREPATALQLDLAELGLGTCSALLKLCTHLQEIALNGNALTALPPQMGAGLRSVWAHKNQLVSLQQGEAGWLQGVELLKLSDNALLDVAPLAQCAALRELWLERNQLSAFPSELARVRSLQRLWLDGNLITSLPPSVRDFQHLQRLSLIGNQIAELPPEIGQMAGLQRLWLDNNLLQQLPLSFGTLSKLETLSLSGNPFKAFPAPVASLTALLELYCNETRLDELDPSIGALVNLRKLGLRNNSLRFVPQTVGHLTKLAMLDLHGNPELTSPPPETVRQGTAAIIGFLSDLIADSCPSYRMKLMIVGQEAVGKTSLLKCLTSKRVGAPSKAVSTLKSKVTRYKSNLSTDGIDIEQWDRKLKMANGDTVKLIFKAWDFAGQEVYYSTHSFFLSNRSIYLVVWSMLASEDQQRVPYWLQSIQARAPKAPIVLVGTHAEGLEQSYIDEYSERVMRKLGQSFPNLIITVRVLFALVMTFLLLMMLVLSFVCDATPLTFCNVLQQSFTAVSCASGLNLKLLLERLDQAARVQPFMGELLPLTYLQLEAGVEQERPKRVPPVLTWDEYVKLGARCNIVRVEELVRATSLLHDMGTLLCYRGKNMSDLSQLVILDPQWLTKMMAQLISTKRSFVKDGLLEHRNIPQMWKEPEYPERMHSYLLRLLQAFDVSFPLSADSSVRDFYAGTSLVPVMLASSHSRKEVELSPEQDWSIHLGRVFDFEFLPSGFFARLTVRMLHLCKADGTWSDRLHLSLGDARAVLSVVNMSVELRVRTAARSEAAQRDVLALLRLTVQSLEDLCDGWFSIRAETHVPCVHCIARKVARFLFAVEFRFRRLFLDAPFLDYYCIGIPPFFLCHVEGDGCGSWLCCIEIPPFFLCHVEGDGCGSWLCCIEIPSFFLCHVEGDGCGSWLCCCV